VTWAVAVARYFFCFGLPPLAPLPLDCQWIYVSKKLVNQVNCNWEEWKSEETHLLRIVSACIAIIKLWSNCPGLSKFQRIDFIEGIDTHDRPQNDIPSVLFDHSESGSPN
jgi:hypothetical protein